MKKILFICLILLVSCENNSPSPILNYLENSTWSRHHTDDQIIYYKFKKGNEFMRVIVIKEEDPIILDKGKYKIKGDSILLISNDYPNQPMLYRHEYIVDKYDFKYIKVNIPQGSLY